MVDAPWPMCAGASGDGKDLVSSPASGDAPGGEGFLSSKSVHWKRMAVEGICPGHVSKPSFSCPGFPLVGQARTSEPHFLLNSGSWVATQASQDEGVPGRGPPGSPVLGAGCDGEASTVRRP